MADTLIVVPTYNERAGLETIVARIRSHVPDADVLIVDDASPDGTGVIADALAGQDDHVTVLHRPRKEGLGRAYVAAFGRALTAGYGYVVEIDADGSHDPADLPAMLEIAREGADLVLGSRWMPGGRVLNWPAYRHAISRTANWYARIMLGSRIRDLTAGFRVYQARLLAQYDLHGTSSQGYCFQIETAWYAQRHGYTVMEHPIAFTERTQGASKMHLGIVVEALWRVTCWGLTSGFGRRGERKTARS